MADAADLAVKKATLAAVEAEIAAETRKFEASIAGLRRQREQLRREYAEDLRAELRRMEVPAARRRDVGSVLAAIEKVEQPIIVRRLREIAGRYVSGTRRERPDAEARGSSELVEAPPEVAGRDRER